MAETKSVVGVPVSSPWGGGGSPFAINSKKFGMWLFIVSDTLTFSALLLAYTLQPPGQSGLAPAV